MSIVLHHSLRVTHPLVSEWNEKLLDRLTERSRMLQLTFRAVSRCILYLYKEESKIGRASVRVKTLHY